MDLGLAGKHAIVTGGSRGIGRAIAERLASEGCSVAICARNAKEVADAVGKIKKASPTGTNVTGTAVDVSDTSQLDSWVDTVATDFSGLDIAVANVSALSGAPGEDSWRLSMEVDMLGTVRTVEPGIYNPDEGFGVRLEDDIVVTEDGPINLMAKVPIEPNEIEAIMNR